MSLDRKYLVCALVYAALGMGLGILMSASHNHAQFVTHAHLMLVGFVVSLLYAIIHKLWLTGRASGLARAQFYAHQAGAATMVAGLYLLYGGIAGESKLEPALAAASIAVLGGALLMLVLVVRGHRTGLAETVPHGSKSGG
jgi:hypothetical protein